MINLIDINTFQQQNLYLKQSNLNIQTKHNLKYVTYAKYLPNINLTYQKTINHTYDTQNYVAGFNVIVPFDIKSIYEPKSALLNELIAKKELQIKQKEEISLFKTMEFKIKQLEQKILLTKQNIIAYQDLIEQTKQMVDVGLKTNDDLQILQNSLENEKINLQIYAIDKQINLLEIYYRLSIEG